METLTCITCRSLIDEEELFCANCGTEAPVAEAVEGELSSSQVVTHVFACGGCGASMSFDAGASALRCPFCGSTDMDAKPDARAIVPHSVVPFAVSREDAEKIMRSELGRGFFRPTDLAKKAALVHMQPVYVPYWVFNANTHTFWTADTSEVPWSASGDWRPVAGEHTGQQTDLLVGAGSALRPGETSALCPFDLSSGALPEEIDLENAIVASFETPRKHARPRAVSLIRQREAFECDNAYVPARSRNVHANVRIDSMSSVPVLLPVWIMAYQWKGQVYRFLINGQTGRTTGRIPSSALKIALTVVGIVAAVVFFILLFMIIAGTAVAL